MKKLILPLMVSMLFVFNAYGYEYEEYIDIDTGTTTFFLTFEDHETYRPASLNKVEVAPKDIFQIPEAEPVEEPAVEPEAEKAVEEPKTVYGDIYLSDEDANALRWVLCLEEEGFEEECRVCEAIFNRVLSEKNWGNTVGEVLAKKGQFSTYRYIGSSKAWDSPGEVEDDVISEVLRETSTRLPSTRYVYFDAKGGVNGKEHVRYGKTTYGRE